MLIKDNIKDGGFEITHSSSSWVILCRIRKYARGRKEVLIHRFSSLKLCEMKQIKRFAKFSLLENKYIRHAIVTNSFILFQDCVTVMT